MTKHPSGRLTLVVPVLVLLICWEPILSASAVPIANDPNGFETIPWGSVLEKMEAFTKVDDPDRVETYELHGQTPVLGAVPVDSLRFTTFEKKLGRVTVRYTGQASHTKILIYLGVCPTLTAARTMILTEESVRP